jgi:hypothetical protein
MNQHQFKRLRKRFEVMDRKDRHYPHRHLLDVMRIYDDPSITDNSTLVESRVPRAVAQELKVMAAELGTSRSALIRAAIHKYLLHQSQGRTAA